MPELPVGTMQNGGLKTRIWRYCDSVSIGNARYISASLGVPRYRSVSTVQLMSPRLCAFILGTKTRSLARADFRAGTSEVVRRRIPNYRSFSIFLLGGFMLNLTHLGIRPYYDCICHALQI
jgi:hypothetical protein